MVLWHAYGWLWDCGGGCANQCHGWQDVNRQALSKGSMHLIRRCAAPVTLLCPATTVSDCHCQTAPLVSRISVLHRDPTRFPATPLVHARLGCCPPHTFSSAPPCPIPRCIKHFFRPLQGFSLLRDLLPSPATLAACLGAAAVTAASNRLVMGRLGPSAPTGTFLKAAALHVAVGACVLAVLLGLVVLRTERGTLRQVLAMRRQRKGGGVAAAEGGSGPGVAPVEGAVGGKRKEE